MPTIKLVVLPTKRLTNGKNKNRTSIPHQGKTKYIPTDYIIEILFQFKDGQVVNRTRRIIHKHEAQEEAQSLPRGDRFPYILYRLAAKCFLRSTKNDLATINR